MGGKGVENGGVARILLSQLEGGEGGEGVKGGGSSPAETVEAVRERAVKVCAGQLQSDDMWQRLQRLKRIPTSVGLNLMEHGKDVAGKEAVKNEAPRKHRLDDGAVFEQDGGRARIVSAIRAAEGGNLAPLLQCRSNADKRLALDTATRFSNQGLILQVVLWLRETMRHDRFMAEMALRPKAVNVYSGYLKATKRWDMLERFFVEVRNAELSRWGEDKHLQRNDTVTELALCKIRRATQAAEPLAQLEALKEAADFIAAVPANMIWEEAELEELGKVCRDWQTVLVRQVEIERTDLNVALLQQAKGETNLNNVAQEVKVSIWSEFPRSCIIGVPVLELAQYLALYHGAEPETSAASPKGLRKALVHMSDKLYWYAAFYSLARRGSWDVLQRATESTSMVSSGKKYTSAIGWRPLINLVYEFGDVERSPQLRTLVIHFAQQMENRLEAYKLCLYKELWEGALQLRLLLCTSTRAHVHTHMHAHALARVVLRLHTPVASACCPAGRCVKLAVKVVRVGGASVALAGVRGCEG